MQLMNIRNAKGKSAKTKYIADLTDDDIFILKKSCEKYNIGRGTLEILTNVKKPYTDFIRGEWDLLDSAKVEIFEMETIYDNIKKLSGSELKEYIKTKLIIHGDIPKMKEIIQSLTGDMRLGISIRQINKELQKLGKPLLPDFQVQLAEVAKEIPDNIYNYFVEEKFDGMRLVVSYNAESRNIIFMTRQGNDVTKIFKTFAEKLKDDLCVFGVDLVLDGELIHPDGFASLQKLITKNNSVETNLVYVMYDMLQYDDTNVMKLPLLQRVAYLSKLYNPQSKTYSISATNIFKTPTCVKEFFDRIIKRGGEGIMLKNMSSRYLGESTNRKGWLKYKPSFDIDLKVVDVTMGQGKLAGKIGALICKYNDQHNIKVGSGISDSMRDTLGEMHEKGRLIDTLIEITYTEKSVNTLRNPRFSKIKLFQ
jgi:ATP-dependent DNA ligase